MLIYHIFIGFITFYPRSIFCTFEHKKTQNSLIFFDAPPKKKTNYSKNKRNYSVNRLNNKNKNRNQHIKKPKKSNENRTKKLTQAGVSLQFFIKKPLALSQNFRERRRKQSRNRDTLHHNSINSYAIPEAVRQKNQTSPFFAPTFHHLLTINSTSISKTPKQASLFLPVCTYL